MADLFDTPEYLRLSEIGQLISATIEQKLGFRKLWITAEIAGLNIRKGHCYLSLVEKDSNSTYPLAEMRGIIWKTQLPSIEKKFTEGGIALKEGIKILFLAKVNYDVRFGLSLMIDDVKTEFTLGALETERRAVVKKLKDLQIYDLNKLKQIPEVPLRIAVISAEDAKGFEDFSGTLIKNVYGYKFKIKLFQALLQGDNAAPDMVRQLHAIQFNSDLFDVVVIVRGGGGIVNLLCFNDFRLCEAIAKFPLPVITGIGHTTNVSVADEVACHAETVPAEAANFLIEKVRNYEEHISEIFNDIINIASEYASEELFSLNASSQRLALLTQKFVSGETNKMSSNIIKLQYSYQSKIENESRNLLAFEQKTTLLDPLLVLKRGYSITKFNGHAVKDINDLKKGDEITTVLGNGSIQSTVTK